MKLIFRHAGYPGGGCVKKYIFSASQCPQGICLTDEFVLITSYSTEDDCMGELMVFDRETGEYMVTLGMDENSHLGELRLTVTMYGCAIPMKTVWSGSPTILLN